MTYRQMLEEGKQLLGQANVPDADLDARLLLENVCDTGLNDLICHGDQTLTAEQIIEYRQLISKRAGRIPLQHLTGEQYFCGYPYYVDENVLIPRQDTELLVEEAMNRAKEGAKILDLCTGSGCVLISLLLMRKDCQGIGTDLSAKALTVAQKNKERLLTGENTRCAFLSGDLFAALAAKTEKFDMIVSNPPYIKSAEIEGLMPEVRDHEPKMALDGDTDGLIFYRRIAENAGTYLNDGGYLLLEIGFDQREDVMTILQNYGFQDVECKKDYAGHDRVVIGRME